MQTVLKRALNMLRRHYDIDERKWRVRVTHRWDQDGEALNRYWSEITRIPLKQFYSSYADKRTKGTPTGRSHYKGVCCVQYGDTTLQYELQAIGEAILRDARREEMVEQEGIEPSNLLRATQALSQLSYCPTISGRERSRSRNIARIPNRVNGR